MKENGLTCVLIFTFIRSGLEALNCLELWICARSRLCQLEVEVEPTLQQQLGVLHSGRACLVLASLERNRFNMVCMGEGVRILKYLAVSFWRAACVIGHSEESCNDGTIILLRQAIICRLVLISSSRLQDQLLVARSSSIWATGDTSLATPYYASSGTSALTKLQAMLH